MNNELYDNLNEVYENIKKINELRSSNIESYRESSINIKINKYINFLQYNIAFCLLLHSVKKYILNNKNNRKSMNYLNILDLSLMDIKNFKNTDFNVPSIQINRRNFSYYTDSNKYVKDSNSIRYYATVNLSNKQNHTYNLMYINLYSNELKDDANFVEIY